MSEAFVTRVDLSALLDGAGDPFDKLDGARIERISWVKGNRAAYDLIKGQGKNQIYVGKLHVEKVV